jgi:hypothetical protein
VLAVSEFANKVKVATEVTLLVTLVLAVMLKIVSPTANDTFFVCLCSSPQRVVCGLRI